MPLETLEQPRIHELTIPPLPKEKFKFDIKKEISEQEWEKIMNHLKSGQELEELLGFLYTKILDPERWARELEGSDSEIRAKFAQELTKAAEMKDKDRSTRIRFVVLAIASIVRQNMFNDHALTEDTIRFGRRTIEELRIKEEWQTFYYICLLMKLIDDSFVPPELSPEEKESLLNKEDNLEDQGMHFILLRVLYPETPIPENTLIPAIWATLRQELEDKRTSGEWVHFLIGVFAMKVIASKEVRFGHSTLEFVDQTEEYKEKRKEPVPESLKF